MDPRYNPYGVLSNMGPGQSPLYTATGQYLARWGRVIQHNGNSSNDYNSTVIEDRNLPAAQPYSDRQMAAMRAQMEYRGDHNAFAWRLNMMDDAQMMEELSRYS
jgi:hypothetical protein